MDTPTEAEKAYCSWLDERAAKGHPYIGAGLSPFCAGVATGQRAASARIRRELLAWLIGQLDPADAGLINGCRITDEIARICPEEP